MSTHYGTQYVGISKRFVAISIDGIIYSLCTSVFFNRRSINEFSPKFIAYFGLITIIHWAYFCLMESSPAKATLGKMALEIAVTDSNGKRIYLKQATVRYFGKNLWLLIFLFAIAIGFRAQATGGDESPYYVVVGLLVIVSILIAIVGYLMAGFTPEKQALHDRIARTFVVEVGGQSRQFPQKALLQIAAIVLVSRFIFQVVPSNPVIDPGSTNPGTNNEQKSEQTPAPPSGESPTPSNSSDTVSLCGVTEPVFPPSPNSQMNGVWRIQFSAGSVLHTSLLRMEGDSGVMQTEFYDAEKQSTKAVVQTINLWVSPRGAWLLGSKPVDAETKEPDSTYIPDNIFLQQTPNGSFNAYNCDDQNNRSPVSFEYVGENTETPSN